MLPDSVVQESPHGRGRAAHEGRIDDPSRRAAQDREAQDLVEKIGRMPLGQIFFVHGRFPETDSLVEKRLREQFDLQPALGLQCREASPYFKEVSVYRSR